MPTMPPAYSLEPGKTFTIWGQQITWTEDHLTPSQLRPLLFSYDKLADQCLDRLDELYPPQSNTLSSSSCSSLPPRGPQDYLPLLLQSISQPNPDPILSQFWTELTTIPPWVSWEQISRGQKVFYRYLFPITTALTFQSLLGGLAASSIASTLSKTNGFSPGTARRRLVQTFEHVLDITDSLDSILPPDGAGFLSTVRVRLLHAFVRRRLLLKSRSQSQSKSQSQSRPRPRRSTAQQQQQHHHHHHHNNKNYNHHENDDDDDDDGSDEPKQDHRANHEEQSHDDDKPNRNDNPVRDDDNNNNNNNEDDPIPINDLHSLATVLSFSISITDLSLPRQGIHPSESEREDYLALWRYVAHLLGCSCSCSCSYCCRRRCPLSKATSSVAAARTMLESVVVSELSAPPSDTSRRLADNLLAALTDAPPAYASRPYLEAQTRLLNGAELSDALLGMTTTGDGGGFFFFGESKMKKKEAGGKWEGEEPYQVAAAAVAADCLVRLQCCMFVTWNRLGKVVRWFGTTRTAKMMGMGMDEKQNWWDEWSVRRGKKLGRRLMAEIQMAEMQMQMDTEKTKMETDDTEMERAQREREDNKKEQNNTARGEGNNTMEENDKKRGWWWWWDQRFVNTTNTEYWNAWNSGGYKKNTKKSKSQKTTRTRTSKKRRGWWRLSVEQKIMVVSLVMVGTVVGTMGWVVLQVLAGVRWLLWLLT